MKKVGIFTFNTAYNVGAIMQAYALQETIKNLGYDCQIINYQNEAFYGYIDNVHFFRQKSLKSKIRYLMHAVRHPIFKTKERKKIDKLVSFCKEHYDLTSPYTLKDVYKSNEVVDTFVLGSDQVWRSCLYGYDPSYFMGFVDENKKLITYAASFGKDTITGFEYYKLKDTIHKFDAISMRERSGCKILKQYFDTDSTNVLDPTFLQKKEFWFSLASQSKLNIKKPFIFIYLVATPTNLLKAVEEYAKKHHYEIYSFSHLNAKIKYRCVSDASLEDFLYYIKNAKCVFTTSFHGLALSINMNTDLYFELSRETNNANARLVDLCSSLGLLEREIKEASVIEKPIDWDTVNSKLDSLRDHSLAYLKDNLK